MVIQAMSKPSPIFLSKAPVKKETKKQVYCKTPTYKKSEKIIENILKFEDNPRHIFRLKMLDRISQEIAKEVLQGQTLLPFDGVVLKKDGLNIYLNIYKKEVYEWVDPKTKRGKDFKGDAFTIIQAEIEGIEDLFLKGSIFKRVKIHIELLRQLRRGVKLKKAVKIARKKVK